MTEPTDDSDEHDGSGHDESSHGHDHEGDEHGHDHTHEGHDHHHHDVDTLHVAVLTVSSSRSLDADPSGDAIVTLVEDAGHEVVAREVVADDRDALQSLVGRFIDHSGIDTVVTTGGTGVTPDDVTIEAIDGLLEKQLPGFGELFRQRSQEEIGTRVIGTRATAGVTEGTVVYCLPGSENAARLGVGELVLAEGPHLVGLARRHGSHAGHEDHGSPDDQG